MWWGIWNFWQNFLGTKQGLNRYVRPCLVSKFFQDFPSHRILRHMHGALNIHENRYVLQNFWELNKAKQICYLATSYRVCLRGKACCSARDPWSWCCGQSQARDVWACKNHWRKSKSCRSAGRHPPADQPAQWHGGAQHSTRPATRRRRRRFQRRGGDSPPQPSAAHRVVVLRVGPHAVTEKPVNMVL